MVLNSEADCPLHYILHKIWLYIMKDHFILILHPPGDLLWYFEASSRVFIQGKISPPRTPLFIVFSVWFNQWIRTIYSYENFLTDHENLFAAKGIYSRESVPHP